MKLCNFRNGFCQSLLLFLLACSLIAVSVNSKSKEKRTCHIGDEDDGESTTLSGDKLLNYLSSKSPYRFDEKHEKQKSYLPFKDCEATKIWYYGRHGTRNPGKKDTIRMGKLLSPIRDRIVSAYDACHGGLSKKQVKKLREWEITKNVTLAYESHLVKQGIKELKGIGKRYRKRFPHLFSSDGDLNKMQIKRTNSQRTVASSVAFVQGVFDKTNVSQTLFEAPGESDAMLKFYETCSKWSEQVEENPSAFIELTDFEISNVMNNTITQVSEHLGLTEELTLEEITIIYTTCAFETAWKNGKSSPWCAAFGKEDLEVMAYREDLDYFWKDGYGHSINYEQACPPFDDLLDFMGNTTDTKVKAYFSHSGATVKMLARLGLFKDKTLLTSDSFLELKDSYKWRTSLIDTMATNLAFVLYECKDRLDPEIGFLFQEKPTDIPACENKWHCSFGQFRDAITDRIGTCDFNMTCSL